RRFALLARLGGSHAAQGSQRVHALAVQSREFDTEVTAGIALAPPRNDAFDDDFTPLVLETTDERVPDLAHVGRPDVHPAATHVEAAALEGRHSRLVSADFYQSSHWDPFDSLKSSLVAVGHECLRVSRSESSPSQVRRVERIPNY